MAAPEDYKKFISSINREMSVIIGEQLSANVFKRALSETSNKEKFAKDLPADVKRLVESGN